MKNYHHQFIFFTKQKFSYSRNNNFEIVENTSKLFKELEKEIIRKDKYRKICTYSIGSIIIIFLIILSFLVNNNEKFAALNLSMGWILIAGFFLWAVLYFIFGFFLYKSINFDFHFKNLKSPIQDKCITYASSNYKIFVDKYSQYLGKVDFNIPDEKNPQKKRKNKMVGFLLIEPKKRNFIFNGKVACNIPYYTLTFLGSNKLCFFPSFVLHINGKNTTIVNYEDLIVDISQSNNLAVSNQIVKITSTKKDLKIVFSINSSFNQNFFNFKF